MDWQPVTVPLSALTPWEKNPKRITRANAKRLLDLWERIGQFQTIAIGPSGEVYDGHQRLSVLRVAYGAEYQVKALQSSRPLTEDERAELTISAHTGTVGAWDWDAGALQGWGMDAETLQAFNFDAMNLRELLNAGEDEIEDHWQGMPEFEQKDLTAFRSIHVHFRTQSDIDIFATLIDQELGEKTRAVWFPKAAKTNMLDIYTDE